MKKAQYFLFIFFAKIINILPLSIVRKLASLLTFILFYIFGYRRKVANENLKFAFPENSKSKNDKIAFGGCKNFFTNEFEMLWIKNFNDKLFEDIFHFEDTTALEKRIKEGKAIILLTGHFGNWEYIYSAIWKKFNINVTAITKPLSNEYIGNYLTNLREYFGLKSTNMTSGVKNIFYALDRKEAIGLAADQAAPQESIYLNFFNRPATFFEGPAIFALRSRAAFFCTFAIRKKNGNYNIFFEEIDYDDLIEPNKKNVIELTRRHSAILEKYIRMYPEQWLWQHKRWKHTDKFQIYGKNQEN